MLFTDYAENKIADMLRGQGLTLPTDWHAEFLVSYSDAAPVGANSLLGLSRVTVARSLAAWAGTQGDGTTGVSTGSSHETSNNSSIAMGTCTGPNSGTVQVTHLGFFDASSGGNCWFAFELATPLDLAQGDSYTFTAGTVRFIWGLANGMSNYLSNKLIDRIWRGQAYSYPATTYAALYTAAPSNSGGGTEVSSGGGYARASIASSLAAWCGTQGTGTTVASTGTLGRISNNAELSYSAPTSDWGAVGWTGLRDASSGGNLLWWKALAAARTIIAGGQAPSFAIDDMGITIA